MKLFEDTELDNLALPSLGEGLITTDGTGRVILMNPTAQRLCGWTQAEAKNRPVDEVFPVVDAVSGIRVRSLADWLFFRDTAVSDQGSVLLPSRSGECWNVDNRASRMRDPEGQSCGLVLVFRDRTTMVRDGELLRPTEAAAPQTEVSEGSVFLGKTGSLVAVLREAATNALTGSGIVFHYSFPENLQTCDFDGPQMTQVFVNLIQNAKQAMPRGGRMEIAIRNTTRAEGRSHPLPAGAYLEISVTDDGEGIPDHRMKHLFEPFFTTRGTGHGLGLTTCRAIIQRHGGDITVESQGGHGTSVRVVLPVSLNSQADQVVRGDPPLRTEGAIVVMDDEAVFRNIIGSMLGSLGYTVIEAACGEDVLRATSRGQSLRAAIFDLNVPAGMGGLETLEAIHTTHPGLPVFATSGHREDPILSDPRKYGFAAGLTKPYHREDLARLLSLHR